MSGTTLTWVLFALLFGAESIAWSFHAEAAISFVYFVGTLASIIIAGLTQTKWNHDR